MVKFEHKNEVEITDDTAYDPNKENKASQVEWVNWAYKHRIRINYKVPVFEKAVIVCILIILQSGNFFPHFGVDKFILTGCEISNIDYLCILYAYLYN